MKYCENCGAELIEGIQFCEECGTPIDKMNQVEYATETDEERVTEEHLEALETNQQVPEEAKPKKKKTVLIVVIAVVVVLAIATIVFWQMGFFEPKAEPASTQAVQAVDQNNLYGTLDWQENQDKTYEAKNSLIEGNSDANLKEIFEESAYFTPKDFKYATDGKTEYHLVTCDYKKDDKTASYVVVFRVNQDKHLEVAELQKNDKKVEQKDFEGFLKKLYKTKEENVETAQTTGKSAKEKNPVAFLENNTFRGDIYYTLPEDAETGEVMYCFGKCTKDYITVIGTEMDYKLAFSGYGETGEPIYQYEYDDGEKYVCETMYIYEDSKSVYLEGTDSYGDNSNIYTVSLDYLGPNSNNYR